MTLTAYRKQIRDAWLSRVGRRALKSHEYEFVKQLFDSQTPVEVVLKAIQTCADRARRKGNTIYSLGVIRADLRTVMAKEANSKVGAHTQAQADWRERWERDLRAITDDVNTDQARKEKYELLLADLPKLSKDQAETRWLAIVQ